MGWQEGKGDSDRHRGRKAEETGEVQKLKAYHSTFDVERGQQNLIEQPMKLRSQVSRTESSPNS